MSGVFHAVLSDRGLVRTQNEDRWFADPGQQLYLVTDGMGGHLAGETAARAVAEILPQRLREWIEGCEDLAESARIEEALAAVSDLSREICQHSAEYPSLAGMGATLVLALIRGMQALVLHMGDSRAYLMRQGRLDCLTRDHTLVQLLVEHGALDAEEAAGHPARNQLTRYMGMADPPLPEARVVDLCPDDRLLLCSDGLSGMLDDAEIETVLRKAPDPQAACRRLVDAANAAGGKDNVTALIVVVKT